MFNWATTTLIHIKLQFTTRYQSWPVFMLAYETTLMSDSSFIFISPDRFYISICIFLFFQIRFDLVHWQIPAHLQPDPHQPDDRVRVGLQFRHHGAAARRDLGEDGAGRTHFLMHHSKVRRCLEKLPF